MNYQNYSSYNNIPPYYGMEDRAYYDRGEGIPNMDEYNMTIHDLYRTPFLFTQEHRNNYGNVAKMALKGIQCTTDLSNLFFSDENIKRIMKKIRKEVRVRTNNQFSLDVDPNVRDVIIHMTAVYKEHARFLPNKIVHQVKKLNEKVIDEILPGLITNIKQYWGYLKEINKPLDPIARPVNPHGGANAILPSVTTTWGIY